MSNPTRVKASLGYTRNMGNFESLRVDVGIEDSVRDGEKATEAFERVYSLVESKLLEKVAEVEDDLKDAKNGDK